MPVVLVGSTLGRRSDWEIALKALQGRFPELFSRNCEATAKVKVSKRTNLPWDVGMLCGSGEISGGG
ncbi:hypothetical protein CC80DRAFT_207907 [Byssothecium circinans]|uniref:Uncharacterized protein n=1 Tax=Byssothecium circinans TaxID=147558 RepID=A0A6A5TFX4_9PLEO|nr:hypothetical protein CC80DRAFT_207907 [Byssothecium circinans]